MKHYKTYTAKKLKLPRRLLFFVIVAVVIFAVTVIMGNVLKSRLEKADIDTSEIPDEVTTASGSLTDDAAGSVSAHDEALINVSAGCLNLKDCNDAAKIRSAVDEVKSAGYNAVSFVVTDSSGRLTYASPAVENASRLTASAALLTYENLKTAVSYAASLGMRCSAVLTKSDSGSDALVAAELANAGFSEILVRGFEDYTSLDNEAVSAINEYVAKLRAAAPVEFGVSLSSDIYTAAYNSPYIEKIFANTEFMAIDMTGQNAEGAAELAEKLQGSFTAYLIRAVLEGSDADSRTQIAKALGDKSVKCLEYVSAPERVADTTADGDTTAQ